MYVYAGSVIEASLQCFSTALVEQQIANRPESSSFSGCGKSLWTLSVLKNVLMAVPRSASMHGDMAYRSRYEIAGGLFPLFILH